MCVCMYVCVCMYICVCMYVYIMYVCVYIRKYVCVYVCIYVCTHVAYACVWRVSIFHRMDLWIKLPLHSTQFTEHSAAQRSTVLYSAHKVIPAPLYIYIYIYIYIYSHTHTHTHTWRKYVILSQPVTATLHV